MRCMVFFLLLMHLNLINSQYTIHNDEYLGEYGQVYNKLTSNNGEEFRMMNNIDKLEILTNDQYTPTYKGACQQDITPALVTANTTKYFEEVAKASGIKHVHLYERPTRPNCQFDYVVLDDVGNSTVSKMYGELCTMEMLTGGAAVGDYDNDGLDDIFFTVFHSRSLLYRNNGDGTFVDVTSAVNLGPAKLGSAAGWVDVDADGDLDLYVTTVGDTRHYLYINHGGYFTEEAFMRGVAIQFPNKRKLAGMTPAFGDYDLDGYIDMLVPEWNYHYVMQNISACRLFRNLGAVKPGYFEDVTDKAGVNMDNRWKTIRNRHGYGTHTFGGTFTDLNNDGYPELLVVGDFGQAALFGNNKDGTFKDMSQDFGLLGFQDSMGVAVGDLNKDGFMDIFMSAVYWTEETCKVFTCAFGNVGNALYLNKNGSSFFNNAVQLGVNNSYWGWGAAFLDYNNDGRLDLAVTNGFDSSGTTLDDYYGKKNSQLFKNTGLNSQMKDVALESGIDFEGLGRGLLVFDYDNDGDEDIVITSNVGPPLLYKNVKGSLQNNWIRVTAKHKCQNDVKKLCDSYGAVITVISSNGEKQTIHVGSKSHFNGQSEIAGHFGLGPEENTITVEVYWPVWKQKTVVENVQVNQKLLVVKHDSINETISKIPKCPQLNIKEILTQPNIGTVKINKDKKTVSYDPMTMTLFDIGMQKFSYSVEETPKSLHNTSTQSGIVTLDFRVSPNMYLPCAHGRQVVPGQNRRSTTFRRLDSVSNNIEHINWGAVSENLLRLSGHGYIDNTSQPAGACSWQQKHAKRCPYPKELSGIGSNRPSARFISNKLMMQINDVFSKRNLSDLTMHFGQLMAHDIDHTSPLPRFEHQYYLNHVWMPITIPKGDTHFDPFSTGKENIPFVRSSYNRCSGFYPGKVPREQVNGITAYLDANMVYGSSIERCNHLRQYQYGRMKLGPALLLPKNKPYLKNENPVQRPTEELYLAGDVRANVQPGLTVLHTLLVREHNRLAHQYHIKYPKATDEVLFQKARRLLISEVQSITYNEYLPAILGINLPRYSGYKQHINVGISTEFSTAAFRFGHSQVNSHLYRLKENGESYSEGHTLLRDAYFKPNLVENGGMEPILRGIVGYAAQEVDLLMVDEMRNALFPTSAAIPGKSSGFDLASMNIQRGRDHGIPDFNTVRRKLGLKAYTNFDQITTNKELAITLAEVYGKLENIDLWVGGLAEDHVTGSELGETFHKIVVEQFTRLRDGDRFWYQANLTKEEIKMVESISLGKIIRMNTDFNSCPDNVFFATKQCNGVKNHQCVPKLRYYHNDKMMEENSKLREDRNNVILILIIVSVVLGLACFLCLLFAMMVAFRDKNTDVKKKTTSKDGTIKAESWSPAVEMGEQNNAMET